MKGKLIVFYGINNLGKSTQARLLVEKLKDAGQQAEYVKYALYNLEPSGTFINDYLRKGNPHNLSSREFQIMQVVNRYQFQPTLLKKLESGINIVAEDYVGTGLAWGIGSGVDENFLKFLNKDLYREDIAFLFKGERFKEATEDNHAHEQNNPLLKEVELIHDKLGKEFKWIEINANESIESIHEQIWSTIKSKLNLL